MTYTHIGHEPFTGHIHAARLYGHRDYRGKTHALNGPASAYSGAKYSALCGKTVTADHDGERFNVCAATDQTNRGVTCKTCKRLVLPPKPFAVRYRDKQGERYKLSTLRFLTSKEAHQYAIRLRECGAVACAVVELAGRKYVSSRSVATGEHTTPREE